MFFVQIIEKLIRDMRDLVGPLGLVSLDSLIEFQPMLVQGLYSVFNR